MGIDPQIAMRLDLSCRKLSYTLLNDYRTNPNVDNLQRLLRIIKDAYREVLYLPQADVIMGTTGGDPDGKCGPGEHWDGTQCKPDEITP